MKVICGKEELTRGTQIVQSVITPRSTLPILANFLFETEGNQIKMSSTDLEVGVICFIKGEVAEEGSITIPAKRFSELIRELPADATVDIRVDAAHQITIKSGKSRFTLMGLPKADYPVLPKFPEEKTFTIQKAVLKTLLRSTVFAVSNDETRYVLNGVYLTTANGTIRFVSTDGRRLALMSRDCVDKKIQYGAIIPTKAINEVQRIIAADDSDGEVKIGITENQIAFQLGAVTIISRLIEGTFPNYDQVIPKKHEVQVQLSVKETLSAVRQMTPLADDKSSTVRFFFGKNILRVSASAQGLGSGESEMDIDYSGGNIEIAFNPTFLIDILKNIDDTHVLFNLTNALNPALITPVKDKNYLCVVMPMRL